MAAPDTTNLTNSGQIFTSNTLPQIRAIHNSLHNQIEEKAGRLRTQVGASYRDLLGTADTIVQMRQDMLDVQGILGRMGGKCGRTVVGTKVAGLGTFRGREDAEAEMSRVARLRLLDACALAVSRLLKGGADGRGERLVLAAKVVVLSRLLVSSFTVQSSDADADAGDVGASVEAAKKNLGGLRRRLLRSIDKVLEKVDNTTSQGEILKALCAYSLASSSGARDVLRHFLNVRAEAMTLEFDVEERGREHEKVADNVLRGLDLYSKTLLDMQALVPGKLSDALAVLRKDPLLTDASLQSLEGLRLDVYDRWCGEEIRYFTPYLRHDDLDGKQVKEMHAAWARKGQETLLEGLANTLGRINEFKAIVELRTSVLERWIRDGARIKGFDPSSMLDGLREAINERLLSVLDSKVSKLRLIGSEMTATLEAWQHDVTDQQPSLWDESMLDMDVSNGASHITKEVVSRLYGRNDAVSKAVASYESWFHLIDEVGELVEQLRRQRWDNDEDEIEDEETIEVRQKLLTKDDPRRLHDKLNKSLNKAFDDLDKHITELWRDREESKESGQVARYLLRILRDIRSRLPELDTIKKFGLANVPSLHEKLAAHTAITALEEFTTVTLAKTKTSGRGLWEGEPALPIQPSPGAFRLLRNVVTSMGDAGLDLWTPAAVQTFKKLCSQQLCKAWNEALDKQEEIKPEEVSTKPSKEAKGDDKKSKEAEKEIADEEKKESESNGEDQDKEEEAETEDKDEEGKKEDAEAAQNGKETKQESKPDTRAVDRRDLLLQWLYDVHLLEQCIKPADNKGGDYKSLRKALLEKVEIDVDETEGRLSKAAQEYWKRTSLLFGLLV